MINIQLTLVIWCGPLSQHPMPCVRHQPQQLTQSAQTINQEETNESWKKARLPKNCFVLPWPT